MCGVTKVTRGIQKESNSRGGTHHGCKEKGCKEEKEALVMSGAKSPRLQGKIVETGVRFEHPFYFVAPRIGARFSRCIFMVRKTFVGSNLTRRQMIHAEVATRDRLLSALRTLILTSTREPSRLMIDISRSTVNRPRSAFRMREKSAAATPVRL
jgi:hypothetical protein